jgi:acetate kinase
MQHLLVLNSGSSSLKFSVFELGESGLRSRFRGNLSGIATGEGHLRLESDEGRLVDRDEALDTHGDAISMMLKSLNQHFEGNIRCIGHRIVHGGSKFVRATKIDESVLSELRHLARFAPLHLPPAIATLEASRQSFPGIPHVACFDTSFHRTMPEIARMLPLTKELFFVDGVEKFGFHGLSYEFVSAELIRRFGEVGDGKVIIAHLGNGCSMVAIDRGKSVDTTMGFSPAGGLVMGTRSGDIDPGLITYFASEKQFSATEFVNFVNKKSGLLGLSGLNSDMKVLLDEENRSEDARRAVEIFCYHARKHIGALAATLGGLDAVVFTGGIGEHAAPIRSRICDGLQFLGIEIDQEKNNQHGTAEISRTDARVRTFVIETNEELRIASLSMQFL